jgi:hypothetical protein
MGKIKPNQKRGKENSIVPIIYAVDLDGHLCSTAWTPEECLTAKPNLKRIKNLHECYLKGIVIIYTARRDELISNTLIWLKRNLVPYHAISNIKMPADIYIDVKEKFASLD